MPSSFTPFLVKANVMEASNPIGLWIKILLTNFNKLIVDPKFAPLPAPIDPLGLPAPLGHPRFVSYG